MRKVPLERVKEKEDEMGDHIRFATIGQQGFVPGIRREHVSPDGKRYLAVADERGGSILLEKDKKGEGPIFKDGRLHSSFPIIRDGRIEKLYGSKAHNMGVLYVQPGFVFEKPFRLQDDVLRHITLWSGLEGFDIAAQMSFGQRGSAAEHQLLAFIDGQHVLGVDHTMGMAAVRFTADEGFFFREVGVEYLIRHVLGRAQRAKTKREVRWAMNLFSKLGVPSMSDAIQWKLPLVPD